MDKTPSGRIVKPAQTGEQGYRDNINYWLEISFSGSAVNIDYYGSDDRYLEDDEIQYIIENAEKLM